MHRHLSALILVSSMLSLVACTEATPSDEAEASEAALTDNDLLSSCPALEALDFTAVVDGDATVKQSYLLGGYTQEDGTVVANRRVMNVAPASAVYNIRFYRDAQGKTKFHFAIGTFVGIASNIDGSAKRLSGSGTVAYERGHSYGELVFTSRRDALQSVVGAVTKLRFSDFDCSDPRLTLDAPIVTLEKASDATEVILTTYGASATVSPSIKWVKKATSAPLAFSVPAG